MIQPPAAEPAGYLNRRYAESLSEWGSIRELPRSGAWLLVREVPGSPLRDALAGYRNLFCGNWSRLAEDLQECADLVSVTAVTDPFAPVEASYLVRAFPDLVRPYKDNYVVDLADPQPSRNHRAKVRRATRSVVVSVDTAPATMLDEWELLYDGLRTRHSLTGLAAFSRAAFKLQLATPGCVATRGVIGDRPVSIALWFVMGDVVHYHLGASTHEGYRASASYALVDAAIARFAQMGLRWLNLGAGAGVEADAGDGLTQFKRGWASAVRVSYLCGRIIDHETYDRLAGQHSDDGYFPAYRAERQ